MEFIVHCSFREIELGNFSFLSDFTPCPFFFFNSRDVSLFADRKRLEILREKYVSKIKYYYVTLLSLLSYIQLNTRAKDKSHKI